MTPCQLDTLMALTAPCPTCHHLVKAHLHPSGMCIECSMEQTEHLAQALVFVVQRLERIEAHVAIRGGTDAEWVKP